MCQEIDLLLVTVLGGAIASAAIGFFAVLLADGLPTVDRLLVLLVPIAVAAIPALLLQGIYENQPSSLVTPNVK